MRVSVVARAALIASTVNPAFGFAVGGRVFRQGASLSRRHMPPMTSYASSSRRLSTTNTQTPPPLKHIGREEMQEILDSVEGGDTNTIVIDVRNVEEILTTGPLSPDVKTLPLPTIMQLKVFEMDDEEFEEVCKFPKPEPDATLVFSCAAGTSGNSLYTVYYSELYMYS